MTSPDAPLDRLLEHRTWVRGLVRSLVLDSSAADDVEQQVWLTAIRHGTARIESPRAWLATVARNWARRVHRGASRRTRREAAVARPESQGPDADPVERAEAHRAVVDAVLALPDPLRLAVLHHYFDGLSVADVASRLSVPLETVRSRLRLARGRLRTQLGPPAPAASWSPALLGLAGLPRDFGGVAATGTAISGGTIAMTVAQKLAFALVVPAAVGAAFLTARAAAPPRDDAQGEAVAQLAARIERIEKAAEAPRAVVSRNEDRALLRRPEAVEARLAEPSSPPATVPAEEPASATRPAVSEPKPREGDVAVPAAGQKVHDEMAAALAAAPGTAEHLAGLRRLAEWLVRSSGPPAVDAEIEWAEAALEREGRAQRVTPAEAADLAPLVDGLAAGHAARPGIASAVAGGWARDERLGAFLTRFSANADPKVHRRFLALLDHHPGAAFSEYVLRLVREERDLAVLSSALDADRIEAAATVENAPSFVQAIESRLRDGGHDAKMRLRAGAAIAIAGIRSPETAAESLRRMATTETDAKVAGKFREGADALAGRNATAKSLEKLFR